MKATAVAILSVAVFKQHAPLASIKLSPSFKRPNRVSWPPYSHLKRHTVTPWTTAIIKTTTTITKRITITITITMVIMPMCKRQEALSNYQYRPLAWEAAHLQTLGRSASRTSWYWPLWHLRWVETWLSIGDSQWDRALTRLSAASDTASAFERRATGLSKKIG